MRNFNNLIVTKTPFWYDDLRLQLWRKSKITNLILNSERIIYEQVKKKVNQQLKMDLEW